MSLLDIVLCSEIREWNWRHFSLRMSVRLSDCDVFCLCWLWQANPPRLGAVSRAQVMITAARSLAYILRIRPCPLWRTVAFIPSIKLECLSLYLPCLFVCLLKPSWYYFCSLSNCFVIMRAIRFPLKTGLDNYFYSHAWLDIFFGAMSGRKDGRKLCESEICARKVSEIITFLRRVS